MVGVRGEKHEKPAGDGARPGSPEGVCDEEAVPNRTAVGSKAS